MKQGSEKTRLAQKAQAEQTLAKIRALTEESGHLPKEIVESFAKIQNALNKIYAADKI